MRSNRDLGAIAGIAATLRACGVAGVLLLGMEGCYVEGMPGHVLVMVDDVQKVYLNPRCLGATTGMGDDEFLRYVASFGGRLRTVEYREIKGHGYQPEPVCRNLGGFRGATYGPLRAFLAWAGVIESPSRWLSDGGSRW